MPNKEQTMITTLEQHCGKCLDAIIIGSIIQCSMICFLILVAIAIVIKIDKKTPKDINRHFQTLHNKSWTLPRHPSDTPKHLLYGKCLTRHHRTLTRSMAPRVKVQATASRGPMWRRKSKPLGTKFLSLGHLRPKSAIPQSITIQNMKFER